MTNDFESEPTTELCRPGSEYEALAIEAELHEHGIDPILSRHSSTAYPGVVDRGRWGAIRVAVEQLARARTILERWREERAGEVIDEEELARAAMEADDVDVLDAQRDALARATGARGSGAAYRVPGGLGRGVRPPGARLGAGSALLLVLSLGLNAAFLAYHVIGRGHGACLDGTDGRYYETLERAGAQSALTSPE